MPVEPSFTAPPFENVADGATLLTIRLNVELPGAPSLSVAVIVTD